MKRATAVWVLLGVALAIFLGAGVVACAGVISTVPADLPCRIKDVLCVQP